MTCLYILCFMQMAMTSSYELTMGRCSRPACNIWPSLARWSGLRQLLPVWLRGCHVCTRRAHVSATRHIPTPAEAAERWRILWQEGEPRYWGIIIDSRVLVLDTLLRDVHIDDMLIFYSFFSGTGSRQRAETPDSATQGEGKATQWHAEGIF